MPIYLFWGEDDFAIAKAAHQLRESVIDPNWLQFNYDRIPGDLSDATIEALNQAMTPVFGAGGRLVWLAETTICHSCSEELLFELKRTLPAIPETSHLLFTSSKKPDGRLQSTKLLQKHAQIQEFSPISSWKTEEISKKVKEFANTIGVRLTPAATQLLAESVGNNTRQLWTELEKLFIYGQSDSKPVDVEAVSALVNSNAQNSLQLAEAILVGNRSRALELVSNLIGRNEPALKIIATLVGQFRLWAIVKLAIEEKEERAITRVAEIGNPQRIYYLRQKVDSISSKKLLCCLPILLELEFSLKQGLEPLSALQTKILQLCDTIQQP